MTKANPDKRSALSEAAAAERSGSIELPPHRWLPKLGVAALLVLLAITAVTYRWLMDPGAQYALTNAPITLGPTWLTLSASEPMRSAGHIQALTLSISPGAAGPADLLVEKNSTSNSPRLLEAEAILEDGRSIPLVCCQYSYPGGKGTEIQLHAPDRFPNDVAVKSVRIRNSAQLTVDGIVWSSYAAGL